VELQLFGQFSHATPWDFEKLPTYFPKSFGRILAGLVFDRSNLFIVKYFPFGDFTGPTDGACDSGMGYTTSVERALHYYAMPDVKVYQFRCETLEELVTFAAKLDSHDDGHFFGESRIWEGNHGIYAAPDPSRPMNGKDVLRGVSALSSNRELTERAHRTLWNTY
jgi:hypothetical protein